MLEDEEKRESFNVIIGPPIFRPLPDGIYRVRLVGVTHGNGNHGPVFKPQFQVCDKEFQDYWLEDFINKADIGKYAKIWRFIKAFSGIDYDVFDKPNLKDLEGKECFIHVERRGKDNAVTEYIPLRELEDTERGHLEAQV